MSEKFINDMPKGWVRGKDQPKWHLKAYTMWRHMWRRVYSNTRIDWFGCLIHPDFKYFSNFITWLESQPNFDTFKNTCHKVGWSVDKDMKYLGNRNYYPEFMTLCTLSENSKESIKRKGNKHLHTSDIHAKVGKSCWKPVIAIRHYEVLLYKSMSHTPYKGNNISRCCKGKLKTYMGYRWYFINYKHNRKYRVKDGVL